MPTSTINSLTTSLTAPLAAAINHLLAQEAWARESLALHRGKEACIDAGSIVLRMRVGPDGMVEASTAHDTPNVTIRVRLADLPLIMQNRERAFSHVKIEGDAEFANTISQLSRGLRWEAEHDLERVLGPIAATRLVGGARSALAGVKATHRKVTENLAEFFLEEKPLLVRPLMLEEFAGEVSRLRDDVERSAKRIARLEQALEQKRAPRAAAPDTTNRPGGQHTLDL